MHHPASDRCWPFSGAQVSFFKRLLLGNRQRGGHFGPIACVCYARLSGLIDLLGELYLPFSFIPPFGS